MCMHVRGVCASVHVCSLVLFSVLSLIMRKLFNVCLPVGMGRGCETVIAERERERESGKEGGREEKCKRRGARQTLVLMQ